MLELSLEQMKRLAEIVTSKEWVIDAPDPDHQVVAEYKMELSRNYEQEAVDFYSNKYRDIWNPSLTGEGWQREQALDVIVAAYGRYRFGCFVCNGDCRKDILHASALALLGDKA